ncbi:LLM class F420-dependent oxidoreductase [Mycolicibacterium farcinogenes]|uniref:LLM class F420-dependent oxidoreductase n=1 Tax=Mycolicibacterium farcinogenes TaxID=1802 RepID=UPI001C8DCF7D|nr:LLM class F420-dependent oxidoreductase [Mycolicibacterium farcinogenes]QZH62930.1 LLM class F420-dependent oxidoreductase [Mycolicibacterium farcinogenes]
MSKPDFGAYGVFNDHRIWKTLPPESFREIEQLGFKALWASGSPPADLAWLDPILDATDTLQVATGIVNIWTAPAERIADSYHRINSAYPDRFLLGIGVGHREMQTTYIKPYAAMTEYLDRLDEYGVPAHRRVVAALGPRLLELAARRSAGAIPYLTTPEHTAQSRQIMGSDAFLAPEHQAVLSTDSGRARVLGRTTTDFYLQLANYVTNLKRLGFSDEDLARPGSDALVDAVVAHGSGDTVATQLTAHLDAGADHVAVHVLTKDTDDLIPAVTQLARVIGLR